MPWYKIETLNLESEDLGRSNTLGEKKASLYKWRKLHLYKFYRSYSWMSKWHLIMSIQWGSTSESTEQESPSLGEW